MQSNTARLLFFLLGWLAVALATIGALLPVLPTVPFLVVALWAFSKSSKKFHHWLYNHKNYGPLLRNWDRYRVIPLWGKLWACIAMAGSFTMMVFLDHIPHWALLTTAIIMFFVGLYICATPNHKPGDG